jgi:hypothetical protein
MPSILKKSDDVYGPLYTSEAHMIEAAVAAYASLASTLDTNGAPMTTEPEAFNADNTETFNTMRHGYMKICACILNFPFVVREAYDEKSYNDPIYWAYAILLQWQHICCNTKSEQSETDSPTKRIRVASASKVEFNQLEYTRDYNSGEWELDEEIVFLTRDYDGPSPPALALAAVLVNKTSRANPSMNDADMGRVAVKKLLGTNPPAEMLETLVATIRNLFTRITTTGKAVKLVNGDIKIARGHTNALKTIADALEAERAGVTQQ